MAAKTRTPATPSPDEGGHTIRVASHLTSIPIETLRVWERRYGFPNPPRREGSNRRLYSAEDIERLRWIARALERGYRPGDVIRMSVAELAALLGAAQASAASPELSEAPVARLLELVARDDVRGVEQELRRAASALGPKRFVMDVAQPLLHAVGDAWHGGKLAIRQEHAVSQALRTQLRALLAGYQDVEARPVVVLATLPGEAHELGLEMVAIYLALSSAKPRLLGTSTPAREIVEAVRTFDADAVGLTITGAVPAQAVREGVLALLRDLPRRVPLWLGGPAAGDIRLPDGAARVVTSWADLDLAVRDQQRSPAGRV